MELTKPIEQLLGEQYDLLGHGLVGGISEIRTFAGKGMRQVFCETKEEFIEAAQGFLDRDAYVGINPRREHSGFASDVSYLTCLVVDIDPVREKGAGSTEQQLESAINLGRRIQEDFLSREGAGTVVSSGSGCHVYFPIQPVQVQDVEALTASAKKWMDLIRGKYGTEELKIDPIFDLPRIIRLWGSLNHKSKRLCLPLGEADSAKRLNYSFPQVKEKKATASTTAPRTKIEERFEALVSTHKRLREIVNGEAAFKSPSESDFEFTAILAKSHFGIEDIKALFGRNPSGNGTPKKGDVERIVGKVLSEAEEETSVSLIHGTERYKDSLDNRKMGIRTGFTQLDEMMSGLKKQKVYILPAARPNAGKTTFIMQIIDHVASVEGERVLMYPSEEGYEPIIDKIVSRRTGVYLKKFQNGTFLEEDRKKIDAVLPDIQKIPLIVVEDFGINPDKVEQGIKKYAPSVVVIDFFQASQWKDPDNVGEKNEAVRRYKKMAKDYNLVMVLLSQLNRGDGGDLKALKGAGALEELGDLIAFLAPVAKPTKPYPVEYELTIKKSKYSSTGVVKYDFYKSIAKFVESDSRGPENA